MKVDLADLLRTAATPVPAAHVDEKPLQAAIEEPHDSPLLTKDMRLRTDQLAALEVLRTRLMASRSSPTLITRNTILRAMVDALLPYATAMHGNTECELRASLEALLAEPPPP